MDRRGGSLRPRAGHRIGRPDRGRQGLPGEGRAPGRVTTRAADAQAARRAASGTCPFRRAASQAAVNASPAPVVVDHRAGRRVRPARAASPPSADAQRAPSGAELEHHLARGRPGGPADDRVGVAGAREHLRLVRRHDDRGRRRGRGPGTPGRPPPRAARRTPGRPTSSCPPPAPRAGRRRRRRGCRGAAGCSRRRAGGRRPRAAAAPARQGVRAGVGQHRALAGGVDQHDAGARRARPARTCERRRRPRRRAGPAAASAPAGVVADAPHERDRAPRGARATRRCSPPSRRGRIRDRRRACRSPARAGRSTRATTSVMTSPTHDDRRPGSRRERRRDPRRQRRVAQHEAPRCTRRLSPARPRRGSGASTNGVASLPGHARRLRGGQARRSARGRAGRGPSARPRGSGLATTTAWRQPQLAAGALDGAPPRPASSTRHGTGWPESAR